MSELPKWPKKYSLTDNGNFILFDGIKYPPRETILVNFLHERARAEAAMARLRVAVEALMRIRDHTIDEDDIAAIALQQIGELPE